MKYDLIIVSKSCTREIIRVTQNCIDSALNEKADTNIIIVETNGSRVKYSGVNEYISYDRKDFCYNHALNLGIRKAKGDIYILANNDIVFEKGWSVIGDFMKWNNFDSASGLSEDRRQSGFKRGDWIYEGYEVGRHLVGWCIFLTKEGYKKIGSLDETFEFWYSDNIYADQLRTATLRHGLFCNIFVNHITSVTLKTLPRQQQMNYSVGSARKYAIMRKRYAKGKTSN